jgi:hypothetical protein
MTIEVTGLADNGRLRVRIMKHMKGALDRLTVAPVAAQAAFFDENGPKGGVDRRCALTVRLPYRPAVRVESIAETSDLAFTRSFDVLTRQLERYRERQLESRRRPKKYFVAQRLLEGEVEAASPASPRKARRKAR